MDVEMVRQALFTLTKAWREVVRELTDPYRPERHYMRGPGPKFAAKHSRQYGAAVAEAFWMLPVCKAAGTISAPAMAELRTTAGASVAATAVPLRLSGQLNKRIVKQ